MKKFYKICLGTCVLFLVIGVGCMIAATVKGVSFVGLKDKIKHKIEAGYGMLEGSDEDGEIASSYTFHPKENEAEIETLNINVGSGELEIVDSEDGNIHLINEKKQRFKGSFHKEDKVLTIEQKSTSGMFNVSGTSKAILQIPSNLGFKELHINIGSGEVTATMLTTEDFKAKLGSGDLELDQLEADKIETQSGSGEIVMTVLGERSDYKFNINHGSGDVEIDGHHVEDKHYSQHHEHSSKSIDITSGSGDVEIYFN